MTLKYAVLGLLVARRGYGYELVQRLKGRLGPAWQLSASTVYAALDQLEGEGLVCGHAEGAVGAAPSQSERRGTRRVVYEATRAGSETFEGWLQQPSLRAEPIRGELALKLAVARREDLPALLAAIEQAGQVAAAAREECAAAVTPAVGRRWEDAIGTLVASAALNRIDGELRWLGFARSALESLAKGEPAPHLPAELISPALAQQPVSARLCGGAASA